MSILTIEILDYRNSIRTEISAKRREKATDRRCEAFRWTMMAAMTITATSCPARWKAVHSVKVSLLIVQVPVQTERLNPRGTNPARKSLSLCVPSRPVYRVYAYASYFLLHVSVSTHGRSCSVTATRSHIRMRDRKLLPPSYIHRGVFRSRPSILFPSRHTPLLRSRSLSRARKETRNKNNKKCFLPFRLYISHLALSSLSQSLILYPILLVTLKSHRPFPFFM